MLSALIDTGGSGHAFIDADYAKTHCLPLISLPIPRVLRVFDGRDAVSGNVTHIVRLDLALGDHVSRQTPLYVTQLPEFPIVIGLPWLRAHKAIIDLSTDSITFNSTYCLKNCMTHSVTVSCLKHHLSEKSLNLSVLEPCPITPENLPNCTANNTAREKRFRSPTVEDEEEISLIENSLPPDSPIILMLDDDFDVEPLKLPPPEPQPATLPSMSIHMINAASFSTLCRRKDHTIFSASLEDIEKSLRVKKSPDMSKLPEEYRNFSKLFSIEESDKLPISRPEDHSIQLKPGSTPPSGPLYNMSHGELEVLRKYLKENLDKGFIRTSSSSAASPVLFAKKPSGGLRLCVDYRGLNALTIKNRYPLPLIRETLNQISKCRYFTKLDIVAAFNKLRMKKGDEWLTAFKTRYGLYEYLVMPFGLANAPSSWQSFINSILGNDLDDFVTAYMDDILIYSDNLKDHKRQVQQVLQKLADNGLQLDIEKCEFHVTEVKYLGLIVTQNGIKMDPSKVSAIINWKTPRNIKEVQSFLGFANFYRRFIADFSRKTAPLTVLSRKNRVFDWTSVAQQAFQELKDAFISAPVLRRFDINKPSTVETDSSDGVTGGILSQPDDHGLLHPVAYFSTRMAPAECNYEIYDKELLAVIRAFEEWRPELEGAPHKIGVITDHKNLEYFMTTKQLSRRQARWSEYLSRFDFEIKFRPGHLNSQADALTRLPGDAPESIDDPRKTINFQTILKPHNVSSEVQAELSLASVNVIPDPGTFQENLARQIRRTYDTDPLAIEVVNALRNNVRRVKHFPLAECELKNNQVYFRNRLFIPADDELILLILKSLHDSSTAGHPGQSKMLELVSRLYWWPGWTTSVKRFAKNCQQCIRIKPSRLRYQGALQPLPIPAQRWRDISLDFIEALPGSLNEWNVSCSRMLVVVDRLTKQAHFIPCASASAEATARMFYFHIFKHHGLPSSIISDRGTQFVSHFWLALCRTIGCEANLSTAFHPETDGQTERVNSIVETYLRSYVAYLQNDWAKWTPSAEFAYNNQKSESTNMSPFFANHGFHPRMGIEPCQVDVSLNERNRAQQEMGISFATKMADLNSILKQELTKARATYEEFSNRHRDHAPILRPGDQVYVDTRNMFSQRPHKKLDVKNEGPFSIVRRIGTTAYEVAIPDDWGHHNVFHSNLLRLAPTDPLPGQIPPVPLPIVDEDGEPQYEVDEILDSRVHRGKLQFRIRWTGYTQPTWEPFDNVKMAVELLDKYFKDNPTRPGHQTWSNYDPDNDADSDDDSNDEADSDYED